MSRSNSGPLAKLNVPLLVLWLASVVVAVAGYLLMTSSNANQAALYTSQTGDYAKLFAAQSGSTVGGLLIAVGVLGVLLALAAQASTRVRNVAPAAAPAVIDEHDLTSDDQAFVIEIVDPRTEAHVQTTDAPAAATLTDADENQKETVAAR
ncbi:hypothetical protein [Cryobacterium tepidiphilum]|uniref:Dinucleotide-utilizing enzyme n=1 Tax=Cryobacterium tepidiphilum TaxID=2486026 RepID=A0A3M8LN80_9MICO|nr:hypothetical protein [Cryobacterium tepidiphilum]RNE66805.1 hypothetical protein EEJ31_03240 [Cryobacterium tepidiphilum]